MTAYELSEVVKIARVYCELEAQTINFYAESFSGKKEVLETAKSCIKAIKEYRLIPEEIRKEFNHGNLEYNELEKLCNDTILGGKK
ncbi:MAG: hypothetical protein WCK29_01395 [archaeon]